MGYHSSRAAFTPFTPDAGGSSRDSISFDAFDTSAVSALPTMTDPQQPLQTYVEGPSTDTATVEAMVFPRMDRASQSHSIAAIDAADEARRIVAEARTTARTMLAQAKDVIAAERDAARERGYSEGHAAGMAQADEETAGLIATCERIGVHVMEERSRVLAENEADTVELAIAIARRIVNAAIEVDPELVVEACRGAMRKAFQRGSMQVLAHPDDLELLRAAGPQLVAELGGIDHLDFIEERRLDRGSIIVRTPAGEIDATIAGKAAKIEQSLREGIEQRRAERRGAA